MFSAPSSHASPRRPYRAATNGLLSASLAALAAFIAVGSAPRTALAQSVFLGTFTASPIYDEQITNEGNNLLNSVDALAAGSNMTLPDFQSRVASAYGNNMGGVVTFEGLFPDQFAQQFAASFGPAQRTLAVTSLSPVSDFNLNQNNEVISGHQYLGFRSPAFKLGFSLPLSTVALTGLSRGEGADRTGVMTITYDNNATVTFPSETIGGVDDDTVFIHAAPAPRTIASIGWTPTGTSAFTRWDDLGFVTTRPLDLGIRYEDFIAIRDNFGLVGATRAQGDLYPDGIIDLQDFRVWKQHFVPIALTAIPEPAAWSLAILAAAPLIRRRQQH